MTMLFYHIAGRNKFKSIVDSISRYQIPFPNFTRFISNVTNPNFTVDYLTKSCGLSPEASLKASKHIVLKSKQAPDTVLSLLNTYGLTKSDISVLVKRRPEILLYDPEKNLKPKLEYFSKLGVPGAVIAKNDFLVCSLEKKIIPSINFLRTLVANDSDVIPILKNSWRGPPYAENNISSNITILRNHGVPELNIRKFLMIQPIILCATTGVFKEKVSEIVKMGFCPSSMMFLHGIHVIVHVKKSKWNEKMDDYRNFGWSEDEVLSLFRKQPFFMINSVKKISLAVDFFTNNWNWSRQDISANLSVTFLSMKKRIIPRCCVLQILHLKNLISKDSVGQALRMKEAAFLERFVNRYHNEVPDLLKIYQTKLGH